MRSSKSRSRSKQNRPRTLGNIINRVFDSSGPEGKVRGTPQQIIEKYQMLARDAQLSNDRVAAENFLQHAEHYTRMLAEAQREMAAEQEMRQQNQQIHQNGNGQRVDYRDGSGDQPDAHYTPASTYSAGDDEDTGLVDLPERSRDSNQNRREDRPRDDNRNRDSNPPRREYQNRDPQGQNRREDRPQGDSQNRRDDRPSQENQPRRDDRPQGENRREPRPPRHDRQEQTRNEPAETGAVEAEQPSMMPRFESPAALVAQIEQAQPAKAPRAPRPPKTDTVDGEAPKPRAPRAKRPAKAETDAAE